MSVVVVVVIFASCAGYGVDSLQSCFFSITIFRRINSLRALKMDFTIIFEYTFSQFQDKNISLTVRKKNIVT